MAHILTAHDAQALSFVQGQAYRINAQVIAQPYPAWDFASLLFVDTTGPEWSPGVITYTSDISGTAKWITAAAKDMPFADVSQDRMLKSFHLAGVGYTYNLEEVNTALNIVGGTLEARRAQSARMVYMKTMYDLTLFGDTEKGMGGLTNYTGVPAVTAPADGTGSVTWWVNDAGVGTKTPAQIARDFNSAISGVDTATFGTILANKVFLPKKAYDYIAMTPYAATTMETILSFLQRTNLYTMRTGQPLDIRSLSELDTAAAGSTGRMVAYFDNPTMVKLHLPMPHRFLPVHQDGWGSWVIPGIFRTGGVEFMAPTTAYYLDGIVEDPA